MDNIYSSLSNSTPPLPGTNPCELVSCECFSKEPLSLGLTIFAPVSSVPGSASFFFLQPLLTGKIFASVGVLIVAQIFLFLADRFFGHELKPVQKGTIISPEQTVRMSLSDLQDFLASVSRGNVQPSTSTSVPSTNQAVTGIFPLETPEIPLVVGLAVYGDFTNKPYCPAVFLLVNLFTFPGVRGAIPLLILELLTTIFVRSVVPPETTGAKPLTAPASNSKLQSKSLQFSPEDLLNLLNRFGKRFGA
ncbi:hypothetical protein E4K67_01295 [Desulfosporosinus fructosivorans]|uniref:Uncharacterized protein n=1 Tax=Desulfosporosinus fructosivorans TaxID=2018669 RepID=A0A4Z0RDR1_9FIRM|nr:hypothetical protein [Desulfosporosinus fructosivorans]TGE39666.1 hypothetical protein E4K67_01295 [Desulfosporosinus fructosivorans]